MLQGILLTLDDRLENPSLDHLNKPLIISHDKNKNHGNLIIDAFPALVYYFSKLTSHEKLPNQRKYNPFFILHFCKRKTLTIHKKDEKSSNKSYVAVYRNYLSVIYIIFR